MNAPVNRSAIRVGWSGTGCNANAHPRRFCPDSALCASQSREPVRLRCLIPPSLLGVVYDHTTPPPHRHSLGDRMTSRTERRADTIRTNAEVVVMTVQQALTNLDLGLAGWPTSTPGASPITADGLKPCTNEHCTHIRPCPIHDDEPVHLTGTERLAANGDRARAELEALEEHIRIAHHHMKRAAAISHQWAYHGLNEASIKARLVAIDAGIWCENCVQYGEHNPRETNYRQCSFCRQFQSDFKRPAPKIIWDARNARGGRIDVGTITRLLAQHDEQVKAERKARKQADKEQRKSA